MFSVKFTQMAITKTVLITEVIYLLFISQELGNTERVDFFDKVLPKMAELALELPKLCSQVSSSSVSLNFLECHYFW